MFSRAIRETALCNPMADRCFQNIVMCDNDAMDCSILSTVRAILANRIGDEQFHVSQLFRTFDDSETIANVLGGAIDHDSLCIINSGNSDSFECAYKQIAANPELFSGYEQLRDVREWCSKNINAAFFVNNEKKSSFVIAADLNNRGIHLIQAVLPRLIPWYIKSGSLTQEERILFISLAGRSADAYLQCIHAIADKLGMRERMIRESLAGFEKKLWKDRLRVVNDTIARLISEMNDASIQYRRLCESLEQKNIEAAGLNSLANNSHDTTDLADYFVANKSLSIVSGEDKSRLEFIVKTYLDSFDPDMFETMSKNPESYICTSGAQLVGHFSDPANRLKLLRAIFCSDPSLKVKVCAYYSLRSGYVATESGYPFPEDCSDYLPNPHLNYYHCLGNYERYINECLRNVDYLGAVAQCIASAKSINICEMPTMQKFIRDIFRSTNKIIELPDGKSVSPTEAFEWLESQEAVVEEHC